MRAIAARFFALFVQGLIHPAVDFAKFAGIHRPEIT